MGKLSRSSSRHPLQQSTEDTNSLTSFPNLSSMSLSSDPQANDLPLMNGLLDCPPLLFDESNSSTTFDAQALSAAPASVVREVINHHGAVKLVKRLSSLLAERDAHVTALKRLAEEYHAPPEEIAQTASRVKQTEGTRLALGTANQEIRTLVEESLDAAVSQSETRLLETDGGTVRGFTKMFGGTGTRREGAQLTPTSSRSTSRPPKARGRPQSIDVQSFKSANTAQSADSSYWATTIFANGFGGGNKRLDSKPNREPVELKTQHNKDQMPPTLSENFQAPQEAEWNKYLMKLIEHREQSGEQDHGGELIGAAHFGQEGVAGQKKLKALNQLILGGIPMNLRQQVWMELSYAHKMAQPGAYEHFLSLRESSDQSDIEAILKDVPRTLTAQYDFYTSRGYQKLKEVLVAFVAKYEDLGYTQGLNTIAGYLLLAIPSAEEAFWVLCNMVENWFPKEYFARKASMCGPLADNKVLRQYVGEVLPQLAKHMDKLGIHDDHTVPLSWFFTMFSSVLPQDALMRIWDVWLCVPGNKTFAFNVALVLLKQNSARLLQCATDGEYFGFLTTLKVSGEPEKIDELIRQAFAMRRRLEPAQVQQRRSIECKVLRRKRDSTEGLYSPQ